MIILCLKEGYTKKHILLSRSGSSLLGELLSLSPATSYYYEPLRQHNLTCAARHNR